MPPTTRNSKTKPNVKAEPYSKENRKIEKRTALNIVTNKNVKTIVNKTTKVEIIKKSIETISKNDITKKKKVEIELASAVAKLKSEISKPIVTNKPKTRSNINEACSSSNESKNNTLYQSAIEGLIDSDNSVKSEELYTTAINSARSSTSTDVELYHSAIQELTVNSNEEELFEIDQMDWNNFMYMGCYARDIFKYLRRREDQFKITDYIGNQSELTPKHRAIIVNWLVSLQDVYGLNHEVLYMAIKLIDLYLMKHETPTDKFQLLASSALLLSCKIDEREPGLPFDLVKLSKYIYTEDELFETEREVARALDYDINVPLSYVFLRRFARCMKCQMVLLTLARYILESSLLDYKFVTIKDSLKAAAALYLAFKMCSKSVNAIKFHKYTGYDVKEIKDTTIAFNNMLHTPNPDLPAIKQKYMHQAFYKVASKSLLSNSKLNFD